MRVTVRTIVRTVGSGQILDSIAMRFQRYDQVVFPFVEGCWVILSRHLMLPLVEGEAVLTLQVEPRNDCHANSRL